MFIGLGYVVLCHVSGNETGTTNGEYESFGIASKHTKRSAEGGQSGDFDATVYINPLFLKRRTK
jgi:hypothetical protein